MIGIKLHAVKSVIDVLIVEITRPAKNMIILKKLASRKKSSSMLLTVQYM